MPAAQCLGRLVHDTKGKWLLPFEEDAGVFHIPDRCGNFASNGDICETCQEKEVRTVEKVKEISGSAANIKGMLPCYLHGRVTEPIPFWSKLYGGAWFRLKMEAGCTLSEVTMAKAKVAVERAYSGVEQAEPQPMPVGKKVRARKAAAVTAVPVQAAAVTAVPVQAVTAVPTPIQAAAPIPVAPPKKRIVKKKIVIAGAPPLALVDPSELPVESVHRITVRKVEIDGRKLFLNPSNDKVYDLKYKYLGRLKEGAIHPFPDSDAECH
jgi:hypothetical protein